MRRNWEYHIVEGGKRMSGGTIRDASTDILNRLGLEIRDCYAVNNKTMPTIFNLTRER